MVTLEDAIYMSMKNDIAIVFQNQIVLLEQQSTYPSHMLLRGLLYYFGIFSDDSAFIQIVKNIKAQGYAMEEAIPMVIDNCIEKGIFSDFLMKHKEKVKQKLLIELDEVKFIQWHLLQEEEIKVFILDSFKDGKKEIQIRERLEQKFSLTAEEAKYYLKKYLKNK